MKNITIKRGELNIKGRIYGDTGIKIPVFILCHGFMANQNMYSPYAKMIAELGSIAVTFDFCGGGLFSISDGKSENMTILTEKEDLMSVIDYLKNEPFTDSIALLGFSQGGLVSILVAKELKEELKSLILINPLVSLPEDLKAGQALYYKFDPNNVPKTLGSTPIKLSGEFATTIMDIDIYTYIKDISIPTLYLQGTKDKYAKIESARKAKDLFIDIKYKELEGGTHMLKGFQDRLALEYVSNFIKQVYIKKVH